MTIKQSSTSTDYTPDNTPFSPNWDVYGEVSRGATLREVKLIGSTYALRPELSEVLNSFEKTDLRYGGECSGFSFDPADDMAVGQFQWTAEVRVKRKSYLRIKSEYLLVYSGLKDRDTEHVEYFFKKVGRFATYPYFRSHFSHHTSESGLMIPPLPTLSERVD